MGPNSKSLARPGVWATMYVMRPNRRNFLGLSLAATLVVGIRGAFGAVVGPGADQLKALPAFLDTLIPADESPSATGVGIDRALLRKAATSRMLGALVRLGCRWLDHEARRLGAVDFTGLDQVRRDQIVARAAAARRGTVVRAFFDTVRRDALALYYADARSWPSLGYDGPPQPAGFPDHTEPPKPAKP